MNAYRPAYKSVILFEHYRFEFKEDLKIDIAKTVRLSDCIPFDQSDINLDGNEFLSSILAKLLIRGKKTGLKETCIITYAGHVAILIVYPIDTLIEIFTSLRSGRRWLVIQDKYFRNKLDGEMNGLRMAGLSFSNILYCIRSNKEEIYKKRLFYI